MKKNLAACLAFLGLLAGAPAFSQAPPPPNPQELPPPPVIVTNFLGFSEEQAAQFRQLLEARHQGATTLAGQLEQRHRALEALFNATPPDPAAIGRLILEIRALSQQQGQILRSFRENFVALLTSEQRERLGQVERTAQLLPAITAFVAMQLVEPPRFPGPQPQEGDSLK